VCSQENIICLCPGSRRPTQSGSDSLALYTRLQVAYTVRLRHKVHNDRWCWSKVHDPVAWLRSKFHDPIARLQVSKKYHWSFCLLNQERITGTFARLNPKSIGGHIPGLGSYIWPSMPGTRRPPMSGSDNPKSQSSPPTMRSQATRETDYRGYGQRGSSLP